MNIDKELEEILDDPLLHLTERESALFDIPTDMRQAMGKKQKADHIAQHRRCEDFEQYRPLFALVHRELTAKDRVTGYIYVLRSLSADEAISSQPNLYKIGFSTNTVEERIANAAHEPTYLMAPVEVVATYKVVNMHSQRFEDLVHQVLNAARFHMVVVDDEGKRHEPKEWFVVPLTVVNSIIEKVMDGSIVHYSYNAQLQCLELHADTPKKQVDTKGLRVLTLNIKKVYFDEIMSGRKRVEYRELKQSTLNKYTYVDEADGRRYLRRYDALRLFVGYHRDRENALVQVVDTTCTNGFVEYHLGEILAKG